MAMNIFERAARGKWRFVSEKGQITPEQLFDLPLQGAVPNLDSIAIGLDQELNRSNVKSFVSESSDDKVRSELQGKLDMVKHVIKSKQADAEASKTRMDNAARRRRILEALDRKSDESLEKASEEELLKELAELGG